MMRCCLPAGALLLLVMVLACRREPGAALIERHYQPDTEYFTTARMSSQRSLHLSRSDGQLVPMAPEFNQELTTRQRLLIGPEKGGACLVELEIPLYRASRPGEALRMNLGGCVGLGRYLVKERRLEWGGLRDSLWQAPQIADSGWTIQALSAPEAAAYLASTMHLLGSALSDSARQLLPGQGYREESRQETMIGPWPAAWTETRTVTLRAVAGQLAIFDVTVELKAEPADRGPAVMLEGHGSGRIDFDLARRFTAANILRTEMTIEIADSSATWIARSSTDLDIRTVAGPPPVSR